MKKIIILGGSRYYLKSIQLVTENGYHTIVLDKNKFSPGFLVANDGIECDFSDKEKVLSIAKEYKVDAIVPLNDVGVPVASYVSQKLGLIGISEEVAQKSTNKDLMTQTWKKSGIPYSKSIVVSKKKEFYEAVKEIGFPCILKPAVGIGGASRGVIVVKKQIDLDSAITFSQSFFKEKQTILETFIESIYEHSAEVLVRDGIPHVIAISDKIKSKLPYRVDKNVLYPTKLSGKRLNELTNTIKKAVVSIGIDNGAAHVELATTKNGYVLFELGARCGGGGTPEPIVSHVTGIPIFLELVKILAGDENSDLKPRFNKGCNYHFICPDPGKIRTIEGGDKIKKLNFVLDFEFFKKENELITDLKTGLDRSGFIITTGNDQDEALQNGIDAEKLLKVKYFNE